MERKPADIKEQEQLKELRSSGEMPDNGEPGGDTQISANVGNAAQAHRLAKRLIGQTIGGQYEIVELVGWGGMSVVFRGQHKLLKRTVAIKFLLSADQPDENMLKRFRQEASATMRLTHPNIVKVTEFGLDPQAGPFLVMEWLEGRSLADVLNSPEKLSTACSINIVQQVCEALTHAHQEGIVHRDIKPGNIRLIPKGDDQIVKVLDFGIAKVLVGDDAQNLTKTGDVLGSPLYMSPEQCQGLPLDARSDVYSVGCVLYELLSGRPPHRGENVLQTLHKHINDELEPVEGIDADLQRVINKSLAKKPEDRFQTAAEFAAALANPTIVRSNRPLATKSDSKRFRFSAATTALMVSLALVGVVLSALCVPEPVNFTKPNPMTWMWHYENGAPFQPYQEMMDEQDRLDEAFTYLKTFQSSTNTTELSKHLKAIETYLLAGEGTDYVDANSHYVYYERSKEAANATNLLLKKFNGDHTTRALLHEIASLAAFGTRDLKSCTAHSAEALKLWEAAGLAKTKEYYRARLRLANCYFLLNKFADARFAYHQTLGVAPYVIPNSRDPRYAFLESRIGDCYRYEGFPKLAQQSYLMADRSWSAAGTDGQQDAAMISLYINYIGATTGDWPNAFSVDASGIKKAQRYDERCYVTLQQGFGDTQYFPLVAKQYAWILWKEGRYLEAMHLNLSAKFCDVSRKQPLKELPILKNETARHGFK